MKIDLSNSVIDGADFSGLVNTFVNLEKCTISNCKFGDVTGFNFSGATVNSCDWAGVDLIKANLTKIDWENSDIDYYPEQSEDDYSVLIYGDMCRAGCSLKTKEEWLAMTEEDLRDLDGDKAVAFYPTLVSYIS